MYVVVDVVADVVDRTLLFGTLITTSSLLLIVVEGVVVKPPVVVVAVEVVALGVLVIVVCFGLLDFLCWLGWLCV